MRTRRLALLVALGGSLATGCMTCFATASEGPRAFGGRRAFGSVAEDTFAAARLGRPYEHASRGPPGLGGVSSIFPLSGIDLPLSRALDLVLLPITIPAEVARANRASQRAR